MNTDSSDCTPIGMHKYRYTRKSPNPRFMSMEYEHRTGHYPGFVKRRDMLVAQGKGDVKRQIYCHCGWHPVEWCAAIQQLRTAWARHLRDVENQLGLNLYTPKSGDEDV